MFLPVFFVHLHPYILEYVDVYLRTHFIMFINIIIIIIIIITDTVY